MAMNKKKMKLLKIKQCRQVKIRKKQILLILQKWLVCFARDGLSQ